MARLRRSLFGKYVTSFVGLVIFVLAINAATDVWITYRNTKSQLLRTQTEKADAAALRIEQFMAEIERQISWATRASSGSLEQRRLDYSLILEHTPAIASIALVDSLGRETLMMSRKKNVIASGADYKLSAAYRGASSNAAWFGPVTFAEDGPHMQISMAHSGRDAGVSIADVELNLLSDILNSIQAGSGMYAYLTTPDGRLIAHTSAGQVRRDLDFSHLPQVAAIESPSGPIDTGKNIDGEAVLTATAPLPRMNWSLFVEQPLSQAFEPIYDLLLRLLWLFAFCVVLSVAVSMLFARRMVVPIKAVQAGAAQIAAGGFTHTIEVHTGDEVEALADEFNRMARQLQESYARLEQKVEDRTEDLGRSVRELQALEEIGRAVAASLDLDSVLATIVTRAAELANADGGAIYSFDRDGRSFHLAKVHGLDQDFVNAMSRVRMNRLDGLMGAVAVHGRPIQVPQISEAPDFPLRAATLAAGFKSALIVPLLSAGGVRGTLIVERRRSGHFPARIVELMQTFAHQCVLAMHNASLFRQVEENSRQLAIASEHKTQFFANMSHELRTPLNAVLGYAELLQDGLYGELPDRAKQVLERIQSNGTHLLGLINDVLDLSKIEAGELSLSLETYSMRNVVENVVGATGSLAQAKALRVSAEIEDALPLGRGDERRLTQVLLNMVSNAIKFTDQGGITIRARKSGENFDVSVEDTGPGIAPEDQARIFEAFQQVDNTSTRQKGGTGLGLSISKRFVEMHGGRIEVSSTLGIGSTFRFILPIHVDQQRQAA